MLSSLPLIFIKLVDILFLFHKMLFSRSPILLFTDIKFFLIMLNA